MSCVRCRYASARDGWAVSDFADRPKLKEGESVNPAECMVPLLDKIVEMVPPPAVKTCVLFVLHTHPRVCRVWLCVRVCLCVCVWLCGCVHPFAGENSGSGRWGND
jgi:hypothetical protein